MADRCLLVVNAEEEELEQCDVEDDVEEELEQCDVEDDVEPLWEVHGRQREVNFLRLCTLIIREGTRRLRDYTKQHVQTGCGDQGLADLLHIPRVHDVFVKLKKSRKILKQQYNILYPEDGSRVQEHNVDISLWVILARNLTQDRHIIDWDKTPGPDDDLLPHHVLRLRDARNRLYHVAGSELTDGEFAATWDAIKPSLLRLGSSEHDLHSIRTCDLDPEKSRVCAYEVQQQALREQCGKLEAEAANKHCLFRGFLLLLGLLLAAFVIIIVIGLKYTQTQSCVNHLQKLKTQEALLQFMPRSGWGGRNPATDRLQRFHGPVDYLVVSQTAMNDNCKTTDECCRSVRTVQEYNMDKSGGAFGDIAFSYLIGGDGVAYEGRGQFYVPATVPKRNTILLSIAFIGYFARNKPSPEALNGAPILIQYLVDIGALTHNTTVLGLCQMYGKKYPRSPGIAIMEEMKGWKTGNGWKWRNINVTDCEGVPPQ